MEQLGFHQTDIHEIWYLKCFSNICRENSSFIKIWQEWWILYVNTCLHLWYLVEFFSEIENFQTKVAEKIKIQNLRSTPFFFTENLDVYETIRKNMVNPDRSTWQYNTAQKKLRFTCRITEAEIQTHTQNIQHLMLFQGNSNYTEVPQCSLTRPLPVAFRVD